MGIRRVSATKFWLFIHFTLLASFTGCITTAREKEMRHDIFNLQTRLLEFEKTTSETAHETKSTGDNANKKLATTNADLEKIQIDISKMKGDLDALKVGVETGKMPGNDRPAEGSVGATIEAINGRLSTLEDVNRQLVDELESLRKVNTTNKTPTKSSKPNTRSIGSDAPDRGSNLSSLQSIRFAFDQKRYKQINEQAESVVKKLNGTEREEGLYMQAESLYRLGQVRDSALKYNELLETKGGAGKFTSQAKMRLGDAFRHLGDPTTAKLYYTEIVTKFPSSAEASKAKERLAELNATASAKKGN